MNSYGLTYISDEDLFNHVKRTVESYSFKISLKSFNSNLIDPIKLTFDSLVYQQTIEQTIENEVLRQLDKSNSNAIGYFHQNIFQYIGDDWEVLSRGYDLQCAKKKYFVEMKNKHNTMNSSSSAKTYMRFQNTLLDDPEATCMLVEVIARKSQNIPWVIFLDGIKQKPNARIRRVSIDKFYELVTGQPNSFTNLCKALPLVISDAVASIRKQSKSNTVFEDLHNISDNVLESLYLLAFRKYEGFSHFNLNQ